MILQISRIGEGCSVHLTKPTLLVVDDDSLMLETLTRLLSHFGFNVIPRSDSLAALSTLQQRDDIAIIVCDYEMPGINGAELATAAKKKNPGMPVFILSGGHPPDLEVAPWDAWFLKGAPVTELLRKLNAVLPLASAALKRISPSTGARKDDDSISIS